MINYPTSLDNDSTLFKVTDRAKTRLSSEISSTDTTIPVLSTALFPQGNKFIITIDNEQLLVETASATSFNVIQRPYADTSNTAHSNAAYVKLNVTAVTHNINKDAIIELQKKVGVDDSTVSTSIDYKLRTHNHDNLYYRKAETLNKDEHLNAHNPHNITLEIARAEDNKFDGVVDFNNIQHKNFVFENDETLESQPRIAGKVVFDTIKGNRLYLDDGDTVKKILCEGDVVGGEGGAIKVQNEGTDVSQNATTLNFVGIDVQAQQGTSSDIVNIFIPPPSYVSNYNTSDGVNNASVSQPTTANRNVSNPNSNFDIGDWTAGSTQSCLNIDTISFNTNDVCLIDNNSSTVFNVKVYDGSGNIVRDKSVTITGNESFTEDDVTINIQNFDVNNDKFQANINTSINIENILSGSGRFSVQLTHTNETGVYSKAFNDIFFDSEEFSANIGDVTITETTPSLHYLSGVRYYGMGSTFEVDVQDIDYLNSDSYPNTQVTIQGLNYGLPTLSLSGNNLTGWTNYYDNLGASYNRTDWAITNNNFTNISSTAIVQARSEDWTSGAWSNSGMSNIAVTTHTTASTRLTENFMEESWRCPITGDFDQPDQRSWDSEAYLGTDDACFINGGCERNTTDFSNYNPQVSQPDYTGQDGTVWLYREFKHDGSASSGFTLNVSGSYNSFEYKLGKAYDGTSTGGTVWVTDDGYDFNEWNNGSPTTGFGGKVSGNNYTFGSNNIVNTNDTMYVRMSFTGSQRITALSINFD